jgi:hypothetical protein
VTTLNVLEGTPQPNVITHTGIDAVRRDDVASFATAVTALLNGALPTTTASAPGDRWLVLRIKEALHDLDDIQQMDARDEPAAPTDAGRDDRVPALILARRVQAPISAGLPKAPRSLGFTDERKGEVE